MERQVKTVVFDLDGTIYQNTHFHCDYLHFLVEGTGLDVWETPLVEFAEEIFAGKRIVMNRFYENRRIFAQTPGQFFRALERRLCPPMSYVQALGKTGIRYLGDAWAVVTLIGETLGLLEDGRCDEIYRRTRARMERTGMRGDPALKEAITALASRCRVILVSNSYEDTVREFLRQLDYAELFPRICSSAGKPAGMIANLRRLDPEILRHPGSVLTIGDHAFNDLMPLASLGARTAWINPFPNIARPACDVELSTLEQLTEFLRSL